MSRDYGKVEQDGASEVSDFEADDMESEYLPHGGSRKGKYRKHQWELASCWKGIEKMDAYGKAATVMTNDFNVAGGLAFTDWPAPTERKIGPFGRKSVRVSVFIFV